MMERGFMMKNKLTSALLAVSMLLHVFAVSIFADDAIVYEGFDELTTYSYELPGFEITGGDGKVVPRAQRNKAFRLPEGLVNLKKSFDRTPGAEYTVSFEINPAKNESLDVSVGVVSGIALYDFIKIKNGRVLLPDGKDARGVFAGKFNLIEITVNAAKKRFDLRVNGKKYADSWIFSNCPSSVSAMYINKTTGSECDIDNITVSSGNTITELPAAAYNESENEDLFINQNNGDYTYFRSNSICTGGSGVQSFFNYNEVPKSGKITREMADYKNPNKGDCIILEKTTGDDVYFETNIKKVKILEDNRQYKYFYIENDLWCSNSKMKGYMFVLRDNTTGTYRDTNLATYQGKDIVLCDGSVLKNVIKPETWLNFKALVDLEGHTAKIYINDELAADNIKINARTQTLTLIRFTVEREAELGTVKVRNTEFTGLVKKPENLDFVRTDVFANDDVIRAYLLDKVSFHHYSDIYFADNARHNLSDSSIYENDEMYITVNDLNSAFKRDFTLNGNVISEPDGTQLELSGKTVEKDGKVYLPLKETAALMGKYTTDDGYGMIIVSDRKMHWKPEEDLPQFKKPWSDGKSTILSELQELNSFLMFERPTKEQLIEEFNGVMETRSQAHPRLFVTQDDFDNMINLAKTDEYVKFMVDKLVRNADKECELPISTYTFSDNYRTYNTANAFNNRMQWLGLAYKLTGNEKYAECAWKNMESVCGFPDFNISHVIDAALYTGGLAIGYDWCYDYLSEEQRSIIENAAINKGMKEIDRAFYYAQPASASESTMQSSTQIVNYFTKWMSNYNTHVNVGLITAALTFTEADPVFCFEAMNHAMRSTEYTMYGFLPSGSWAESPSYWTVTVGAMVKIIASLESVFGRDFGFCEYQGFRDTGLFYASFTSPNGLIAYCDETGDSGNITTPEMSFLSKRFNQPALAAYRRKGIQGDFKKLYSSAVGLFDLLYYTPGVDVSEAANLPHMSYYHGLESVAFHEDYTDPNGFFFVAYGGLSYYYHAHNDGGAFAFDMLGERWATDLGKEDYNIGIAPNEIYRKRTEGHNTLTINNANGYNQDANAFAPLIEAKESELGGYAVMDMSDYYKIRDAESVKRGFYIDDGYMSLTVRDEMVLNRDSEVYWFMHTKADIDIVDEKTAILSQNGKSIVLQFETNAPTFELTSMAAQPLPSSPQKSGQNPNTGFRKVAIRLNGSGEINLTVRMSPYSVDKVDTNPISQWKVPEGKKEQKEDFGYKLIVDGTELSRASSIPVLDKERIPEWKIVTNDPTKIVEIVNDPKKLDERVEINIYSADRSKKMQTRLLYSTTADTLLDFFTSYSAESISVSDEPEEENPGKNAIDGDIITRWCAKQPDAYGIIDFGSPVSFDAFAAGFWKGNERKYTFELYASNDGESYEPIDDGKFISSGISDNYEIYRLNKVYTARYIKFVNKGNSAAASPNNEFSNLTELKLLKYNN